MSFPRNVWALVRDAGSEFSNDGAPRLAAALAFYTALSLAPLLLLVIAIAGMVFGEDAARGQLVGQLKDLTGTQGAEAAESLLAASRPKEGGLVATVVGVVTLLIGATGVFAALQDALNTVWNVPAWKQTGGVWGMVKDRLLSFSMVCGMAFLLLVSLVVSAVLSAVGGRLNAWLPGSTAVLSVANVGLSVGLTFLMFAMIFKVLPKARPDWSDVWFGAGVTAVLFTVGKHLIGLYLGQAAVGSTFGAAGSFVVLLVWIYYSSMILLFGAELTQVYATRHGSASANAPAHVPEQPAAAVPAVAMSR